ncbi:MAG: hypothetical protein ACP5P4_03665 [Steroidobacteraceae bacterium]
MLILPAVAAQTAAADYYYCQFGAATGMRALARDLCVTMDRRAIPKAAQNHVLAKLATVEPPIATR